MSTTPDEHRRPGETSGDGATPPAEGALAEAARRRSARERRWREEGIPATMRQIGQIGVLGWIIVAPTLLALFAGRWLDHLAGTRVFFSAPLLMLGAALGAWSAWRWMHRP